MSRRIPAVLLLGVTAIGAGAPAAEIRGTVSAVDGQTATVQLEGSVLPAVGDAVEIVATIPGLDQEAQVAMGRVTAAAAGRATVRIERATGAVAVGHRAKIAATGAPVAPRPPDALTVPDLVGAKASDAKTKLQAMGLTAAFHAGDPAPTADRQFTVYRQEPAAGAAAKRGDVVALTIHAQFAQTAGPELAPAIDVPTATDRQITKAVAQMLQRQHVSHHALDDEISRRTLQNYLRALDPMRMYFNQADIDQFSRVGDRLDDLVREGDLRFAYLVFETFLRRVDQRVATINELVGSKLDFQRRETLVTDGAKRSYARDQREARDAWRKRVKYELLAALSEGRDWGQAREKILRRYQSFRSRMYQVTGDELLEMYLTALCHAFDAQSRYLSPVTLKNAKIQVQGQLDGIGAALSSEDGQTVVTKLIPGGPAARDGRLRAKDQIIGVGQGDSGPITDVEGMKLSDVVQQIRGRRGTTVRLQVQPAAGGSPQVYAIVRDQVKFEGTRAKLFTRKRGAKSFQIGYLDLPSLYGSLAGQAGPSATKDVQRQLDGFRSAEADLVVLDLRRNSGGSLTEAISLTGLFLAGGPVLQVRGRDGRVQAHDDPSAKMAWEGPLVVLTSRTTSSGAEITAAAMQDYGRGLLIGDRTTHGNGAVASLSDVASVFGSPPNAPQMGALRLVRSLFYRPSGNSVQIGGVAPDVVLPSMTDAMDLGVAFFDQPLRAGTVARAAYQKLDYAIDQSLRAELAERSRARRAKSDGFRKLQEQIARYEQRKHRTEWAIDEPTFRAEHAAQADEAAKADEPGGEGIEADFYLDEAFEIALDYLSRQKLARARDQYRRRRYAEAWKSFAKAVYADPEDASAAYHFAWSLATCPETQHRNGKVAVGYAQLACRLSDWKSWTHLLALAVAHAEAGEFDEAQKRLEQALDLAPDEQRAAYEYLRERFRNKQPF